MKKPHFTKTIGIVGGAGPMASAFLYSSILRTCQRLYKSNDYHEFPEIVLISHPFQREFKQKIPLELSMCFGRIEQCGAKVICIASHSFHGLLPKILPSGFVNLVDVGLAEASRMTIKKALILSAPLTIDMRLYERSEIECVYPDESDQESINLIIREIAGGHIEPTQSELIQNIINRSHKKHLFDGVIVACTELPLAHSQKSFSLHLPIVDTIQVLAHQLVLLALTS